MTPRLTVVMPMKGRNLFTFRFLWYANKLNLPYQIIIADGRVHEDVALRLENSAKEFPSLDVHYLRYPADRNFSCYFAKVADAVARVRTPYVMLADNDDFLGFGGIETSLEFLDAHPDYVCARGRALTFSLFSGSHGLRGDIVGRVDRIFLQNDLKTVADEDAAGRLRNGGLCHGLYYAAFRTPALACICREVSEIDFSDLMLHEDFFALRALTLGKARSIPEKVSYFSQAGTGLSYQPGRDWARHLLRSRFTSDAHAVIERVSSAAADVDGGDRDAIAESVTTMLERYYGAFLAMNYGPKESLKRFVRQKWPRLIELGRVRPGFFVSRMQRSIFSELKSSGADERTIVEFRRELDCLATAISNHALVEYAGSFLPHAAADATREWV